MEDLEHVNKMWDSASVFTEQQQRQWAINEALTNGRHITARKAGRSSIFVPKIPSYVKRKLADLVGQFAGDEPISIKNTITSSSVGAKIRQRVHNYYIRNDLDYESIIYNGGYSGLVYNYAPIFLDWEEVTSTVKETGEDGKEVDTEYVVSSRPIVRVLPPEDCRVDASVPWDAIDDARYIGFRLYKDKAYAKGMEEAGIWPKINENMGGYLPITNSSNTLSNERKSVISPFQNNNVLLDVDNDLLEIRYHYFFKEIGNEFVAVRQVTLGDIQILEDAAPMDINWGGQRHGWPFVIGQVYPKPFEQYAPALPEQGKDLQIEVNAIRNQRRDNVALILNPEKYVTPHAGVTPAQLAFSYPGKIVSVDNLNAIQWKTVPDVTTTGHNEESRAEADMDRLFAEGALRQGQSGVRKESATAIQMMAANSSASTGLDTTMFMVSAIRPMHIKLGNAIAQKAPEELFTLAAKDLGVSPNIDPYIAAVQGDFVYNVYAASQQNDIANMLSNISNIMGVVQTTYGPNANYKPLIDGLLEVAGYDPDMIIPDPRQQGQMVDMAQLDKGGVQPSSAPSIQPRARFQGGGAMAEGGGGIQG